MTTNERETRRQWANHTRRLSEAAATASPVDLTPEDWEAPMTRRSTEDYQHVPDLADVLYAALVNLADVSALILDMMRMGYDADDAREHPDAPTVEERLAAALDDAGIAIARMERGQA